MDEELSKLLANLGFTGYEAKTYMALLQQSPLTGYAIARLSGVPRSKIYEVLGNMVERGDVLISYGEPIQYSPKPPKELIDSRRLTFEKQLTEAESGLTVFLNQKTHTDLIWDIRGYEEIIFRLKEVIGRASQQILLKISEEDVTEIREELAQAALRGVTITIVTYGQLDLPFAQVYLHEPGGEEITSEYGGRCIVLSIDGQEVVTGIVPFDNESRAAWSSHQGIVMPITEQIKHDLYIAVMLREHRKVLEDSFGPSLRDLRKQFGPPGSSYRMKP